MTRSFYLLNIILLFFSIVIISSCDGNQNQNESQVEESIRTLEYVGEVMFLRNQTDTVSVVSVAVADDNSSRSEGLMNVTDLPADSGMLFIFPNSSPRSFYMANTPLSLDILFINSEMEIVRIHRNTQPYSRESILSDYPARYVVEVNAGYTIEHDIREGMSIDITGVDQ